ncbi:MAG TPA: MgtC/SapB family protein [Cyclobacteriaceae bacterium]|nr:MgtC/SapB family protein [Cyclobacteriaceae bacterium]HMV11107.1 MgtC/SapB family protein [Cyclobacteriaceae bacterium]HMV88944.1 MgtC/SapB family protein [Cyclobacteriaceae bacterium]HMX01095.1 MgtC/SapB family protein [Cyclobacteriaceae bacterium]HMX51911.1 MgtC/SapB family protein [Cyclobacteriaceae bacterium]
MEFDLEIAFRLVLSFIIGTALGVEREYRSKAAGLRTMIVICLGSTIFTEISMSIGGNSPDRIASNIITGIGFLGAGVIFKDGLTISGITTATTIWISAALGMAVGAGEYMIAVVSSIVVLIVLTVFEKVKLLIENYHQVRTYRITLQHQESFRQVLTDKASTLGLRLRFERDLKNETHQVMICEFAGRREKLDLVNEFLKNDNRVKSYDY